MINSNVFASGCYEHANEYWFYMIDERQVLFVLNHEPRFLSITPDTGLIDLHMMSKPTHDPRSSSILPPSLIESYQALHTFVELYLEQLQSQHPDRIIDERYAAVPLVTAVYFNPSSHVPSPILHHLRDGTEITNYPDSLAQWAQVNSSDRTALYDAGCTTATPSSTCTETVQAAAQLAEQRFWHGIRMAIRHAELQRLLQQHCWQNIVHPHIFWKKLLHHVQRRFNNKKQNSAADTIPKHAGLPSFRCRKTTRFGAGPTTVRINAPFTLSQMTLLFTNMNYSIDPIHKRIVPVSATTSTDQPETTAATRSGSVNSEL